MLEAFLFFSYFFDSVLFSKDFKIPLRLLFADCNDDNKFLEGFNYNASN